MKVFSLLFSVFILALACYPCSDRHPVANDSGINQTAVVTAIAHSEPITMGDDCCSPFCFCLCCTAHAQLRPSSEVFNTEALFFAKGITPVREGYLAQHCFGIWQPPKLSTSYFNTLA